MHSKGHVSWHRQARSSGSVLWKAVQGHCKSLSHVEYREAEDAIAVSLSYIIAKLWLVFERK